MTPSGWEAFLVDEYVSVSLEKVVERGFCGGHWRKIVDGVDNGDFAACRSFWSINCERPLANVLMIPFLSAALVLSRYLLLCFRLWMRFERFMRVAYMKEMERGGRVKAIWCG